MPHATIDSETRAPQALYFPFNLANAAELAHGVPPSQPLSGPLLQVDALHPQYSALKRSLMQSNARGPYRSAGAQAEAAVAEAASYLRARMAELPHWAHAATRLAALDLDALMLELQEDLAIMLLPPGFAAERARTSYLHVCFPSGWDPAQMLGKNFLGLHARVPRHEPGFEKSDQPGHAASLFERPAERYVWSLTADDALDRHPQTPRAATWQDTAHAYLRVERQLIVPLGTLASDGTALMLFFIRMYVYPMTRLDTTQRAVLAAAVSDMSEPMRRYKGLLGHEPRILELLSAS